MELGKDDLSIIIKRVMEEMSVRDLGIKDSDGTFDTMEEAIDAAYTAQKKLLNFSIEERERLIAAMRKAIVDSAMEIATLAVSETGMGRIDHKYLKMKLVAEKTPGTEVLKADVYTGDKGLTLIERGAFGVIGAITPSTNPAATVACNAIGMIAGGNTVVFAPHPGSYNTSLEMLRILNKAIKSAGGPENLITAVRIPNIENTKILMNDKRIRLLVATGGPEIVRITLSSGKKAIGAGAGNPPVVVDETADIKKAARDIIAGCSFDNNLPCIAEKEVIAVENIYEELISEMKKNRAVYELNDEEAEALKERIFQYPDGSTKPRINRDYIGRNAATILSRIKDNVPQGIECLIYRADNSHPFVQEELMMPILPIVKAKDVDEAIELAVLDEHGNRHTGMMHSKNVENLTKMARAIDTTIFVKNAPSYAGIGFGGEGHTTFTIAGPTGEGLTNALSFTRVRRCTMVEYFRIV